MGLMHIDQQIIRPRSRKVYDTGRVLIGLRAGENRPAQPASNDEQTIQDLMTRGFRPAFLPKRTTLERRDWIEVTGRLVTIAAVVLAVLALAYKLSGPL